MIAHSVVVLFFWILSIFIPFIAAAGSKKEECDGDSSQNKTHFMRG